MSACGKQPPNNAALGGRLEAANAILEVDSRNGALAKLAIDAAKANDAVITEKALGGITSTDQKNGAAVTAALALAERGDTVAATFIAKLIVDTDIRNRTLESIAKGD